MLLLGNMSIMKVMDLGIVNIKMYDGALRTLGGVAYVSNMCKNLLLLSMLDS